MLNLILMRHGEAQSRAPSDAQRRLTDRGKDIVITRCEQLRSRLVESAFGIDRIVTSPYVRACQTAALAQAVLSKDPSGSVSGEGRRGVPVEIWDEVTPSGTSDLVARKLAGLDDSSVLLVTHQPFISHFITYLLGAAPSRAVVMQTASIVMIQQEVVMLGAGSLEWVIDKDYS